jgi:hypothetical protein
MPAIRRPVMIFPTNRGRHDARFLMRIYLHPGPVLFGYGPRWCSYVRRGPIAGTVSGKFWFCRYFRKRHYGGIYCGRIRFCPMPVFCILLYFVLAADFRLAPRPVGAINIVDVRYHRYLSTRDGWAYNGRQSAGERPESPGRRQVENPRALDFFGCDLTPASGARNRRDRRLRRCSGCDACVPATSSLLGCIRPAGEPGGEAIGKNNLWFSASVLPESHQRLQTRARNLSSR